MWHNFPILENELELFEQVLQNQFNAKRSINSYLDNLSLELIQSGGKRLRPAMTIATAMVGDYNRDKVLYAALSIEMLHTATLVHDDIIDNAKVRRNVPTIFAREGVNTAIFAGDYIYVKSILALANTKLPVKYLQQLAKAIEAVCVGEVEQYRGRGIVPGFKTYLTRVTRKTAILFAASCAIGAHLGGLQEDYIKYAARFGGYYGIAFQIKDDLLDITENQKSIGKPVGNDLKEGIVTLPALLASAKDPKVRKHLESFLQAFDKKKISKKKILDLLNDIVKVGGIKDTQIILDKYIKKAKKFLDKLPDTPGKEMLHYMLDITFEDPS